MSADIVESDADHVDTDVLLSDIESECQYVTSDLEDHFNSFSDNFGTDESDFELNEQLSTPDRASNIDSQIPTVSASFANDLLLLAFKLRYNIAGEAINDLLKLCNFFSEENSVSSNKYFFSKQFESCCAGYDFYYLCEACNSYVKDINHSSTLPCNNCDNVNIKMGTKKTFFAYLSLENQLKDLLENHGIDDFLTFPSNNRASDHIRDVVDGDLYKSKMLSGETNLSLCFNSDGVPVFKSSSCSIWPIFCSLNELPPNLRKEHVLLVALWFGDSKPNMNKFFEPFINELCHLHDIGFSWICSSTKSVIRTKVKALIGVCDSVARPTLQSFCQFNGKHGCSFCYEPGIYVKQGDGGTRAYPYDANSVLRTNSEVLHLAEMAFSSKKPVLGVKGPSILQLLPEFDIIQGLVPDYMHSVLLGVVRQMSKLWFDSSNHSEAYYISPAHQRSIDFALSCIRPPCNISRLPRSISVRRFWKAHEWYMWLCYYSLPILQFHLPHNFHTHWALLVDGVSLLLTDSISQGQLQHSESVLKKFVIDFQTLYGLNNVSFNVHLCLHLTTSVRCWGPLWAHSAFIYEAFNGTLLEMIKGTQGVPLQICKTYALQRSLPMLIARATSSENCSSSYNALLQSLIPGTRLQQSVKVGMVTCLGRGKLRQLSDSHFVAMNSALASNTVVQYFSRVIVRNEIVHSSQFARSMKRNSYTVQLNDCRLFTVECFIKADLANGADVYALGYLFEQPSMASIYQHPTTDLQLTHILSVSRNLSELIAIRAECIAQKCIFMHMPYSINRRDIICRQLNMFEYCI